MEKLSAEENNIPILVGKLDHLKDKVDILSTSHESTKKRNREHLNKPHGIQHSSSKKH